MEERILLANELDLDFCKTVWPKSYLCVRNITFIETRFAL